MTMYLITLLRFAAERKMTWQSFKWLLTEILSKETKLYRMQNGRYVREVRVGFCHISYRDLVLYEVRQVFRDGRETARFQPVAGKLRYNKDARQEMRREIMEEIGIDAKELRFVSNDESYSQDVYKFPGTDAFWINRYYEYRLSKAEFKEGGYKEVDKDKSTYFEWRHKDVPITRNSGKWVTPTGEQK